MTSTTDNGKLNIQMGKVTDKPMAYTNCVYLHPDDMEKLKIKNNERVLINESIVHQVREDKNLQKNKLGSTGLLWSALHLKQGIGKTVKIQNLEHYQKVNGKILIASTLTVIVDTYAKTKVEVNVEALENYIFDYFTEQIFSDRQSFIIKWKTPEGTIFWLKLTIAGVYQKKDSITDEGKNNVGTKGNKKTGGLKNQQRCKFGHIDPSFTNMVLQAKNNPFMKLITPKGSGIGMKIPAWDPEEMGIGGLNDEFGLIFRRAFASRLYPPEIVAKLNIKHVKGMLLFGPPGTGKTLIARNIGSMLTDNEPKVVNGPEILNKYVGQSEENIRKLFSDAITEEKEKGNESSLHIIIFDEIDAICKQRGSSGGGAGAGVHDTVVNQILSMIDGVNALNNVLIIGMTNRKDLLDNALLRSGRLEVHIEIGLPNENGREQIFRIHTKSLRENNFIDKNISMIELSKQTKNYTGAEIEGVVRSAVSFAMNEYVDPENLNKLDLKKCKNLFVSKEYFDLALNEVKPELGQKNNDKILYYYSRGIFSYNKKITELKKLSEMIINGMNKSSNLNKQTLLLEGPVSSGKTAIASYICMNAKYPFLRIITPNDFVGDSDFSVSSRISQLFSDAYKSTKSIIIIDDLERLIGYTVGVRFSSKILQTLLTCIRKENPNPERKIFIVVTCKKIVIDTLEIDEIFDYVREMPLINHIDEIKILFNQSKYHKLCVPDVESVINPKNIHIRNVGVKDLLTVIELSITENQKITEESFKNAFNAKFFHKSNYNKNLFEVDEKEEKFSIN